MKNSYHPRERKILIGYHLVVNGIVIFLCDVWYIACVFTKCPTILHSIL